MARGHFSMATVTYPHIELRDDGVPIISGTRMKVVQIVLDKLAHGWDAEEIQRQYPQWNLSLGQIHSALAYYYDHQAEFDRQIRFDQQTQPSSADQAWIGGNGQHTGVLAVEPKVIPPHLATAGRDQVGQGASAERQ